MKAILPDSLQRNNKQKVKRNEKRSTLSRYDYKANGSPL